MKRDLFDLPEILGEGEYIGDVSYLGSNGYDPCAEFEDDEDFDEQINGLNKALLKRRKAAKQEGVSKVKRKRQTRVYKSGKEAPAYNDKYDDYQIYKLAMEGKSFREIARILGIASHNTVSRRLRQYTELPAPREIDDQEPPF